MLDKLQGSMGGWFKQRKTRKLFHHYNIQKHDSIEAILFETDGLQLALILIRH